MAEIKSIEKNNRNIDDPDVLKTINAQLNFQNKIKNNASIVQDISMGGFDSLKIQKKSGSMNHYIS